MTDVETTGAWLSREDLDNARDRLPILYVHAIPVRADDKGVVTHIGLLLRAEVHEGELPQPEHVVGDDVLDRGGREAGVEFTQRLDLFGARAVVGAIARTTAGATATGGGAAPPGGGGEASPPYAG